MLSFSFNKSYPDAANIVGIANRKENSAACFLSNPENTPPKIVAASGYDLLKEKDNIHSNDITILLVGGFVAFIVAIVAVKGFIAFLNKYGFKHFGYYRIILGALFLAYALSTGLHLTA